MPRRRPTDLAAIDALLRDHERVVRHHELSQLGMAKSTVTYRIGRRGPWQRLLPGVVLAHRGTPTHRERLLGAISFVGPEAVITGLAALQAYGIRAAHAAGDVAVLQPASRQRGSYDFVRITRTHRMPRSITKAGIPYATPARALVDACRELKRLDDVRELVAEVIQRRLCTVREVTMEVRAAARQRTALSREVLVEVGAGIRSVAEAKAREIYRRAGVPEPQWNAELFSADGDLLLVADGYWAAFVAALEMDSMAWHLAPARYRRTQERQRIYAKYGIALMSVAPGLVIDDPETFVRDTRAFLTQAARRIPPTGIAVRTRTAV